MKAKSSINWRTHHINCRRSFSLPGSSTRLRPRGAPSWRRGPAIVLRPRPEGPAATETAAGASPAPRGAGTPPRLWCSTPSSSSSPSLSPSLPPFLPSSLRPTAPPSARWEEEERGNSIQIERSPKGSKVKAEAQKHGRPLTFMTAEHRRRRRRLLFLFLVLGSLPSVIPPPILKPGRTSGKIPPPPHPPSLTRSETKNFHPMV